MAESQGDIEEAVGNFIRLARQTWLARPDSPALLNVAHRLVDDDDVADAVIGVSLKLGAALYGIPVFPRDADDRRILSNDRRAIIDALRNHLVDGLRDGRFVAHALSPDGAAKGRPFVILAARWSILAPDFERSAATCEGQTVAVGITVEVAAVAANKPTPVSDAEFNEWFANWESRQSSAPGLRAARAAAEAQFGDRITRSRVDARYRLVWKRRPGRPPK
jgi:hypothetical protein